MMTSEFELKQNTRYNEYRAILGIFGLGKNEGPKVTLPL